jgi:hypothetical protein
MEGAKRSRTAKVAAAIMPMRRMSSAFMTRSGIKYAAIATTVPSRAYLKKRMRISDPSKL